MSMCPPSQIGDIKGKEKKNHLNICQYGYKYLLFCFIECVLAVLSLCSFFILTFQLEKPPKLILKPGIAKDWAINLILVTITYLSSDDHKNQIIEVQTLFCCRILRRVGKCWCVSAACSAFCQQPPAAFLEWSTVPLRRTARDPHGPAVIKEFTHYCVI